MKKAEPLFLLVLRVAMAALLLFSAWVKLKPEVVGGEGVAPQPSGPFVFALAVSSYEILPSSLVPLATFAVPWVEVVVAVALLVGWWTRGAGLLAAVLLATFTAAVVSVILRGMNLSCGCFGKYKLLCDGSVGWCKVGENLVLLSMAWVLAGRGGGMLELRRSG